MMNVHRNGQQSNDEDLSTESSEPRGQNRPTVSYRPDVTKPRPLYDEILRPSARRAPSQGIDASGGNALVVGPHVQLKGEIAECDTLIVQGRVEAQLDNRQVEVAEGGVFAGNVTVDTARIAGRFAGNLTVRGQLTIERTGEVEGSIRYGRLSVEEGALLAGDIHPLNQAG